MYREYPGKRLLLFPFSLHIQFMPNFNRVFKTIFSTPDIHHHFPHLHIKQQPFKFNSVMARSSKRNHNKKHNQQKPSRTRTLTSPSGSGSGSGKLLYTVYKIDDNASCARVCMPNCTQMDMFSSFILYICDGEPPADFDAALGKNIYVNSNLDSMIY